METNIYLSEFEKVAKLAFSMWNRDPASPSFGSFDRQYWGWKYKDFSDASLQFAVKLALDYATLHKKEAALSEILKGYVSYCQKIQLKDGSFNQCYPFEKTPGVVYELLSTFLYVRKHPALKCEKARATLDAVIDRSVRYILKTDEKHGKIANHIAQYSHELLNFADYSGDPRAREKGLKYLEQVLSWFDQKEGWFMEYAGPDAGYQTRTLRYLVKIASLLDSSKLWGIIAKGAEFVEQLLMPDGSIHPMLGVRSTAIVYPSAFESLAAHDEKYAPLAKRIHNGWKKECVPLPSLLDFGNAIKLADDARDASMLLKNKERDDDGTTIPNGDVDYPHAGITIRRTQNYHLYVGHQMGGVLVLYTPNGNNHTWNLTYEDSGYLMKWNKKKAPILLTRTPQSGKLIQSSEKKFSIRVPFSSSLHDEMSPIRLVILRILNLTVLRFQYLGDLFRKYVVKRLMAGYKILPMELDRTVEIQTHGIKVSDQIQGPQKGQPIDASLYHCRRITGIHMASSRYLQKQELEQLSYDWISKVNWPQNTQLTYEIPFHRHD